jgi:probable HAF family extracellular repeat protein
MMGRTLRRIGFSFYLLVVCAACAVAQGTYTQIDFPSALLTNANGINRAGQIVGSYSDNAGGHGFLLQDGVFTTIDYPGAQSSSALGINDTGQIVGTAEPIGYVFDTNRQSFTAIQYPGALYTYPVAINNAGAIAGYFQRKNLRYQGFALVHSGFKEIVPSGSTATFVNGISGAGNLVGYAGINGIYSNCSFLQGKFRTITIPSVTDVFVLGTNPAGTALVGYYQPFSAIGFVYQNGFFQALSFPGSIITAATGINSKGDVVGYFVDSSSAVHGFLWTPSAGLLDPTQPR